MRKNSGDLSSPMILFLEEKAQRKFAKEKVGNQISHEEAGLGEGRKSLEYNFISVPRNGRF